MGLSQKTVLRAGYGSVITLATIIGLARMALAVGPGSKQYAPLVRAIIGGLTRIIGNPDAGHRFRGIPAGTPQPAPRGVARLLSF